LDDVTKGKNMKNKIYRLFSAAVLMAASTTLTHADDSSTLSTDAGFSPVLYFGLTFGGDTLAEIEYVDDDDDFFGDRDIDAGGLLVLGGGFLFQFSEQPFSTQVTVGYHFDSEDADNGSVDYDRTTVDIIGFYNKNKHRLGAGITYHLSPELSIKFDDGPDSKVDFDDEAGLIVEYNYQATKNIHVGARYTAIEYSPSENTSDEIDANHLGLMFYYSF